jgi:hypothetical protein
MGITNLVLGGLVGVGSEGRLGILGILEPLLLLGVGDEVVLGDLAEIGILVLNSGCRSYNGLLTYYCLLSTTVESVNSLAYWVGRGAIGVHLAIHEVTGHSWDLVGGAKARLGAIGSFKRTDLLETPS